ncbi:17279_t:CDS:2, partial [Funneliformis geosporum]
MTTNEEIEEIENHLKNAEGKFNVAVGELKNKEKRLDELLEGEVENMKFPSKKARVDETDPLIQNLSKFWNALPSADIVDDILSLESGVFPNIRDNPSKIFIRKAYTDIFKEIKALIESHKYYRFVITGNPGIGKSYFLFYLLYELAKSGETVVLDSHERVKCIVFKNAMVKLEKIDKLGHILNEETTWYLVDTKKPLKYGAITILVSSPNPQYYK